MHHAERQLLDGIARIIRQGGVKPGWVLIALHLSRIPPPGPRAHHRRIASAVLEDLAGRSAGQVFPLSNGDMALLFRPADGGIAAAALVGRLFQADAPDPATLRTAWLLPDDGAPALDYIGQAAAAAKLPARQEPQASAGAIAALTALVQTAPLQELMHRQTAILLRPGQAEPIAPLFREVAISTVALEARMACSGQAQADPFLFGHLMAQLDSRMLTAMLTDLPARGVLSGGTDVSGLNVNLAVAGILSDRFAAFAEACRTPIANGLRVGIEVPYVEVFADPKAFVLARERLRLARMQLVLDGVNHHTMLLTAPAALKPDLLKLSWSPGLKDAGTRLNEAVDQVGADRIVLHRVEGEAALAWGLGRGIHRFQGRYVDQMLAAERLRACSRAQGCTLRACTDRAAATNQVVRAGCGNHRLLDAGAPTRALEAA